MLYVTVWNVYYMYMIMTGNYDDSVILILMMMMKLMRL